MPNGEVESFSASVGRYFQSSRRDICGRCPEINRYAGQLAARHGGTGGDKFPTSVARWRGRQPILCVTANGKVAFARDTKHVLRLAGRSQLPSQPWVDSFDGTPDLVD